MEREGASVWIALTKRWSAAVKQAWKPMRGWGYERRRRCLFKRGEIKGKVTGKKKHKGSPLKPTGVGQV